MKKVISVFLSIMALFFASCSTEILQDPEFLHVDRNEIDSFQHTWQEQVEYAKSKGLTKTSSDDIVLIKYIYKGKIENQKQISELLEQMLSDEIEVVTYLDGINYDIVPLKVVRENAKLRNMDDPRESLKVRLDSIIKLGMEVIDLEWSYKGRSVYSTAIASNKQGGILYDHIGYMIVTPSNRNVETISDVNLIKTRSESFGGDFTMTTDVSDSGSNKYGQILWRYSIYCSSTFDGNGILRNRNKHATSHAENGWRCDARIETISGEIGISDYHEFEYAYAYGTDQTISIGWNGTGFTISGGGTKATCSLVHRR